MNYDKGLTPLIIDGETIGYKLLEVIVGSNLYGTNDESSDIDIKIVYVATSTDFYGRNYEPQVNVTKDNVAWEIGKFLDLLYKNEHMPLDMLNAPKDKIVYVHETMKFLFNNKDKFLTKKTLNTFWKASYSQIKKAKGTNKKMNWDTIC